MNSVDDLIEHLDFLARSLSFYDERYIVKIFLLELGIPTQGNKFDYVSEAVMLWYSESMRRVSKEIYPAIAKKYRPYATMEQVEKTISRAIERAWKKRDQMWETFFPEPQRPTNTEFISRMAKVLEMWVDRCEFLAHLEGGEHSEL